jgi:hypothetical protein
MDGANGSQGDGLTSPGGGKSGQPRKRWRIRRSTLRKAYEGVKTAAYLANAGCVLYVHKVPITHWVAGTLAEMHHVVVGVIN